MNVRKRWLIGVLLVVASVLLLTGCGTWLFPAIDGTWSMYGDMVVQGETDLAAVTDVVLIFDSGYYKFSYDMTDPYPGGTSTASSYEGTMTPADPEAGTAITLEVEKSTGSGPSAGNEITGIVVVLDRNTLVLEFDMDGPDSDLMSAMSFERQ